MLPAKHVEIKSNTFAPNTHMSFEQVSLKLQCIDETAVLHTGSRVSVGTQMVMIWRWESSTSAGQPPEIFKFHTCYLPQEWTWLHYINHIHYLTLSGMSQGMQRLNDTTGCQEAPRVATWQMPRLRSPCCNISREAKERKREGSKGEKMRTS